ncbi:MAG: mechanosensitive ion channel family protein [Gaiellales bacterium]
MISLPGSETFTSSGVNWVAMIVIIVLAIVGAVLVPRLTVALMSRRLRGRRSTDVDEHRRAKRADTIVAVVRSLSRYAAIVIGILAVFAFGFTGAGSTVLGVSLLIAIVGFAAQSVLRDMIAGTMVVAERWFDVGDAITIEPWAMSGIVEAITLRSVKLRGLGGESMRIHNQHMYGVRVARNGIRELAVEMYVSDAAKGRDLVRRISELLPSGPMHLLSSSLQITQEEQLGSLTRIAAQGSVPPGREWLLESFAISLLKELDVDGVIKHGPVSYFADPVAEQRFSRSVAPQLDLDRDAAG